MIMKFARKLSRVPIIGKVLKWGYHRIKWSRLVEGSANLNGVLPLFSGNAPSERYRDRTIDIIVPVYNAYDYLSPLFNSLYDHSDIAFNLILINDASTDPRISALLEETAAAHPNVILLDNSENLGFVQSVNKGLSVSENDVVIVNSDVEVPPNWLSRLMYPIYELENVASATPMSNSSTITSFPNLMEPNELFEGQTLELIDAAFWKLTSCESIYIDTPTGHGFCMAMARTAINKIGYFDEVFGKGCGEENDWCMRAIRKGFRNVIVPNLFCFHKHTASFSQGQKDKLVHANMEIVRKRYPDYSARVKKTAGNGFYQDLRLLLFAFLCNHSASKTIVCLTNSLSGGSMFANKDFVSHAVQSGAFVINLRSAFRRESYQLEFYYMGYRHEACFDGLHQIESVLSLFDVDEVMIHQLCGYVKLEQLLEMIQKARQTHGFKLTMDIRDFFVICPTVQLLDADETFCHACVDERICDQCMSRLDKIDPSFEDISQWRQMWRTFLSGLDKVIVYSNFTREMFLKVYGDSIAADRLEVGQIPIDYMRPVKLLAKSHDHPIHIGVIGNIGVHKGLKLLNEMAERICRENKTPMVKLYIIGKLDVRYNHPHFCHVGEYQREHLPDVIEEHAIDIIFIPSIWGETFCRTAEEGMLMGMPTACYDLGAPAERVRNYEKGLVINKIDARHTLNEINEYITRYRNGES